MDGKPYGKRNYLSVYGEMLCRWNLVNGGSISWWQTALMEQVRICCLSFGLLWNSALCYFQMGSQYQRSVPLEVRRAEGERVRAKHPDKIPVGTSGWYFWRLQTFSFISNTALLLNFWIFCWPVLDVDSIFSCRSKFSPSIVNYIHFFYRSLWNELRGHERPNWTKRNTWCLQI